MNSDAENPIGRRIKAARLAKGLTQQDLAELSGVSQQTIAKIEAEKIRSSRHTDRLIAALGEQQTPGQAVALHAAAEVAGVEPADFTRPPTLTAFPEFDPKAISVYGLHLRGNDQLWDTTPLHDLSAVQMQAYGRKVVGFYVAEPTMSPAIEAGDVIVVNARLPVVPGTDCVFISDSKAPEQWRVVVRRLKAIEGDNWIVEQFNPPLVYGLPKHEYPNARRVASIYRRP